MAKKKAVKKNPKTKRYMYIGLHENGHRYVDSDDFASFAGGDLDAYKLYKRPLQQSQKFGCVYDFKAEGQSIIVNSGNFVGSKVTTDRFCESLTEVKASVNALQAVKAAGNPDPFIECLKPIHQAYKKMYGSKRRALLVNVMTYVMTGKKL